MQHVVAPQLAAGAVFMGMHKALLATALSLVLLMLIVVVVVLLLLAVLQLPLQELLLPLPLLRLQLLEALDLGVHLALQLLALIKTEM